MPSFGDRAHAQWLNLKPRGLAFAIGLIAGPVLSGYLGFQVTSGTAADQVRLSQIDQHATICAARARIEVSEGGLEWNARHTLAQRWAAMPGSTTIEDDVVMACAQKLAR